MIKRLVVKGLNHRADGTHDLEFHPDLNLFTGPNGSGKTTLLKLIWYLSQRQAGTRFGGNSLSVCFC